MYLNRSANFLINSNIAKGNYNFNYASCSKAELATLDQKSALQALGYYLPPEFLFGNIVRNVANNKDLYHLLERILCSLEFTYLTTKSNYKGIFYDAKFGTELGNITLIKKNELIGILLKAVSNININQLMHKGVLHQSDSHVIPIMAVVFVISLATNYY